MNSSSAVSITVRYNIPRPYDEKEEAEVRKKKFDDSNTVIMRMGLPPGTPVGKVSHENMVTSKSLVFTLIVVVVLSPSHLCGYCCCHY